MYMTYFPERNFRRSYTPIKCTLHFVELFAYKLRLLVSKFQIPRLVLKLFPFSLFLSLSFSLSFKFPEAPACFEQSNRTRRPNSRGIVSLVSPPFSASGPVLPRNCNRSLLSRGSLDSKIRPRRPSQWQFSSAILMARKVLRCNLARTSVCVCVRVYARVTRDSLHDGKLVAADLARQFDRI